MRRLHLYILFVLLFLGALYASVFNGDMQVYAHPAPSASVLTTEQLIGNDSDDPINHVLRSKMQTRPAQARVKELSGDYFPDYYDQIFSEKTFNVQSQAAVRKCLSFIPLERSLIFPKHWFW